MEPEEYEQFMMQKELQAQQAEAQMPLAAPQLAETIQQQQAVLVEQTNPKKVIKDIMLRIMGQEEKPDGTRIQVASPKMNKVGIENLWFNLNSFINDNIRFSHLDNKEIKKIMDILQEDIVDDLAINWKKYGITRKTDLDAINNSILVNIFAMLKRAEGQNEKNWIGRISVENISSSRIAAPKQGGFLSRLKL